jgi:hypothetical protein
MRGVTPAIEARYAPTHGTGSVGGWVSVAAGTSRGTGFVRGPGGLAGRGRMVQAAIAALRPALAHDRMNTDCERSAVGV